MNNLKIFRASAGTGKTYTLAAYYIGLLMQEVSYRNILAVTFTNKATAEMKERILNYLHKLAHDGDANFLNKMRELHPALKNVKDEDIAKKAQSNFDQMLQDFDNVEVSTIDSFLQTLLTGMAKMIGVSAGFSTELDIKGVITHAVDTMLTTHIDQHRELISYLTDYLHAQLENENRWDIRDSLIRLAMELYTESVQMMEAEHELVLNPAKIQAYKKDILQWEELPIMQQLKALTDSHVTIEYEGTNSKDVNSFWQYLDSSLKKDKKLGKEYIFRGLTAAGVGKLDAGKYEKFDEAAIREANNIAAECRKEYWQRTLTAECLNDMQLMEALLKEINAELTEENRCLLAKTASILHQALKPGDAEFILEKAGIRYKHIMMDEFQDTSRLQWKVFEPLIGDLLASGDHTLLIVGDIKQSIYRWRNGDWHIMDELGTKNYKEYVDRNIKQEHINRRSRKNVVKFNLEVMKYIIDNGVNGQDTERYQSIYNEDYTGNIEEYYSKGKGEPGKEGYARFAAYPYHSSSGKKNTPTAAEQELTRIQVEEDIMRDMMQQMEELMARGENASDILILVRRKAETQMILKYVQQTMKSEDKELLFPHLSQVRLVSDDSYHLSSSQSVMTLISALRYMSTEDTVAGTYVEWSSTKYPETCLERICKIDRALPLYETIQELIQNLLLAPGETAYTGTDIAYMNCFMDAVKDYVNGNDSSREGFLQYWDDVLNSQSIAAPASNMIRIMTIHGSKGLEAKSVFIPFCNWELENSKHGSWIWCKSAVDPSEERQVEPLKNVPIRDCKEMMETDYAPAYIEEHENQRIDSLNMLYVALTRAADNLYVYTEVPISSKNTDEIKHIGQVLLRVTDKEQELRDADKEYVSKARPCYVEYIVGESPYIDSEAKTDDNMFSFAGREQEEIGLYSDSSNVHFVPSRGANDALGEAGINSDMTDLGLLCHELLSHVTTRDQVEPMIARYMREGTIAGKGEAEKIRTLIERSWTHEELCDWFSDRWRIVSEQDILFSSNIIRPDRVMIREDEVVVLDYKFGMNKEEEKYHKQVSRYMQALRDMGAKNVSGYIWYAQLDELVKV